MARIEVVDRKQYREDLEATLIQYEEVALPVFSRYRIPRGFGFVAFVLLEVLEVFVDLYDAAVDTDEGEGWKT